MSHTWKAGRVWLLMCYLIFIVVHVMSQLVTEGIKGGLNAKEGLEGRESETKVGDKRKAGIKLTIGLSHLLACVLGLAILTARWRNGIP